MEAAFFDLDRTVIARASLAAYGPVLRREGYLNVPMALKAAWGQVVYRFFGADDDAIDRARRTALRLATGVDQESLRRLARDHLAEVIEPIGFDEALELLDRHRDEGRLVVLVSASPVEIVEPLATHLGVDEFVATTPEVDPGGRYTALGDRVPLDRRWGVVSALTLLAAMAVWSGVRRARRRSRAAARDAGVRSIGPS